MLVFDVGAGDISSILGAEIWPNLNLLMRLWRQPVGDEYIVCNP